MKGIRLERFYEHPPERVWQAIATSRGIAAWLMPNDFEPLVGHRFTLRWKKQPGWRGFVECEVLSIDAPRKLEYSWVGDERRPPLRVRFTLSPAPGGTMLLLEHDGFEGFGGFFSKLMMQSGWKGKLLGKQLPHVLRMIARSGVESLTAVKP